MPMRTFFIMVACAITVAVGAVAMSWSFGNHARLEQTVTGLLAEDREIDLRRNFSPYCAVGACPKVTLVSTLRAAVSDTEMTLRAALARQQYTTEYADGWYRSTRPGSVVRYRVTRDGTGSRIELEASTGR